MNAAGGWDRQGRQVSFRRLNELFEDVEYRTVAKTFLDQDGSESTEGILISTVWLGIDHGIGDGSTPVIFETMVFHDEGHYLDSAMVRYSTEEAARQGHEDMVEVVRRQLKEETSGRATD